MKRSSSCQKNSVKIYLFTYESDDKKYFISKNIELIYFQNDKNEKILQPSGKNVSINIF